jgi:hypothetical protein
LFFQDHVGTNKIRKKRREAEQELAPGTGTDDEAREVARMLRGKIDLWRE